MQKKIQSLQGHYIICGFGRVGRAAAEQFIAALAPFVVLDQNLKDHFANNANKRPHDLFVEGDATRERTLLEAGIKKARGLLALLGSDPENVFLVLTAREMNPTLRIIARANDPSVEKKLNKAGADNIISPFTTAGTQVANEMLLATGQFQDTCVSSSDPHPPQWQTLEAGDALIGRSIEQAAQKMNIAIIGLRRGRRDKLMPEKKNVLKAGDALLFIGSPSSSENASGESTVERRVVIIDDNPVIVKLYTRLFQKAGFIPHTAGDGEAGLELIEKFQPVAAVIDFMLPVLSGIEICQHIRKNPNLNKTRLILFTADDNKGTRQRALSSGADAVVVKSPEAQEVIETVIRIISEKSD